MSRISETMKGRDFIIDESVHLLSLRQIINLNTDIEMWQASAHLSKVGGLPRALRFPPPHYITKRKRRHLKECECKFHGLELPLLMK